jgi:hypothetical protein
MADAGTSFSSFYGLQAAYSLAPAAAILSSTYQMAPTMFSSPPLFHHHLAGPASMLALTRPPIDTGDLHRKSPPMSEADLEAVVSNLGKGKGGHLCIYCGKIYSRKYGLKIHIRTHTGYKPLQCKVCLRPFGDPSNLNKHIRLHAQGDTPYK